MIYHFIQSFCDFNHRHISPKNNICQNYSPFQTSIPMGSVGCGFKYSDFLKIQTRMHVSLDFPTQKFNRRMSKFSLQYTYTKTVRVKRTQGMSENFYIFFIIHVEKDKIILILRIFNIHIGEHAILMDWVRYLKPSPCRRCHNDLNTFFSNNLIYLYRIWSKDFKYWRRLIL